MTEDRQKTGEKKQASNVMMLVITDLVNNMPKASFFLDICYWLFADLND